MLFDQATSRSSLNSLHPSRSSRGSTFLLDAKYTHRDPFYMPTPTSLTMRASPANTRSPAMPATPVMPAGPISRLPSYDGILSDADNAQAQDSTNGHDL